MATAPLAVNPGVGFRMTNLRPFDVPAAILAVSVGLLCIPPLRPPLHRQSLTKRKDIPSPSLNGLSGALQQL